MYNYFPLSVLLIFLLTCFSYPPLKCTLSINML
nr:MAG TPA: hypothetical protein [Caudoviricetes sp.]DAY91463.1 MAG TPA: hypothetical protein [Caudoviricetes sp.]